MCHQGGAGTGGAAARSRRSIGVGDIVFGFNVSKCLSSPGRQMSGANAYGEGWWLVAAHPGERHVNNCVALTCAYSYTYSHIV